MSDATRIHSCSAVFDRRDFLRNAALVAGAVMVGLGTSPDLLLASSREIREVAAVRVPGAGALRSYALPSADGASVDVENEVLLVRWAGVAYAFALACPHRGVALEWQSAGTAFCPKHKARFSPDGSNVGGRATRALDRYPLQLDGTRLLVDLSARLRVDADAAAWSAAAVSVGRR